MKRHYIARGLCVANDCVLLAKDVNATNTFLPGGHIEFGENAMDALEREILEEIGVVAHARGFVGAVEHFYESGGAENHEINLVFAFESKELADPNVDPLSKESHLVFFWCPKTDLDQHNLLPSALLEIIDNSSQHWASTIPKS